MSAARWVAMQRIAELSVERSARELQRATTDATPRERGFLVDHLPDQLLEESPPKRSKFLRYEPLAFREDRVKRVWFPLATVFGGLAIIALTIALGGS